MTDSEYTKLEFGQFGASSITQILHWPHPDGDAHCLVRFQEQPSTRMAIAIVSEIRSNFYLRGITGDFANLAKTFLLTNDGLIAESPEEIDWIAHHGDFSSYDGAGQPTTFTRIALRWDGQNYHDSYEFHRLLKAPEVDRILSDLNIPFLPVPQVLQGVGWKY